MDTKKSYKLQASGSKLKNKKILITAGPTWIPIDSVRVISNIATGETGILLAEEAVKKSAKVTLVLGPVPNAVSLRRPIRVIRFKFFDELKNILKRELSRGKYAAVIHSAAVSDYHPKRSFRQKLDSDRKRLSIDLVPTEKLIDLIRRLDKCLFLVGFKFEPDISKRRLLIVARRLIKRSASDLVAANTVKDNRYQAYIISKDKISGLLKNKHILAQRLINRIGERLCKN